jgi:PAS domain-containing protein
VIEDRDRSVKPPWTRLLVSRFTDPAYTVRPDPDLTIDGWNHGIELTLGWSAAEAIGRPAEERLRPTIDAGARASKLQSSLRWRQT